MNYQETIQYLYDSAPLFQQIGGAAYKPGLQNSLDLDRHFGHPHRRYRTIHVAGTNGKGSCAHTLAAVLRVAGYRVGLYTSPHLVDFRERIRVDGEMIPEQYVVDFVARERAFFEPLHPSFFELTTALAFKYFEDAGVDIAVIETGLGGRLDCTNIITPVLSLITNISLDHTQFLGDTPERIAAEKAGIIKSGVPAVVGEAQDSTRRVFREAADRVGAPLYFAEDAPELLSWHSVDESRMVCETRTFGRLVYDLPGACQSKNVETLLCALKVLREFLPLDNSVITEAFSKVKALTHLRGRWEVVHREPMVICDTGHNPGGWQYLGKQLGNAAYRKIHVVFGMAGDKDIDTVLSLLPPTACYYFTKASVRRAMNEAELLEKARLHGLHGVAYPDVPSAFRAAVAEAAPTDLIYVGGSSFIVADFLASGGWEALCPDA